MKTKRVPPALWLAVVCCSSMVSSVGAAASEEVLELGTSAITSDVLSHQNGKSDLDLQFQISESQQNALLQDNQLSNSVTGDNSLTDNALSSATGITTVIQNTGNQVIIQGTTMVNVLINQ
ncbi:hypothetical protein G8770_13520 [Aestuariicella hydrocarbonica]|uniref:Minor curlin subunit n=1 Tax=Pseudomaricurvus hydrocarbonicus TaxID=1470433 RepID=A0A9E5MM83_9GAMM|nr:hypothetical protein [Aestuariicella hydrocarbonica]NHO66563.1 hypothetical protein [Aestuariicella hydrocarbonica]